MSRRWWRPGEYSVRGGLIDLFPMGTQLPYRIELFDDEVETLRTFDVDSQRTLYPVPEIRLLPAREFPLGEPGRNKFRSRFRETFEGDASRIALYKDVSNGALPAGIEYYLPLFFDETATLFDYLPKDTRLLAHHDVPAAIAEFWRDTTGRHNMLKGDRSRPVLPPGELFLSDEQFFVACQALPRYHLAGDVDTSCGGAGSGGGPQGRRAARRVAGLPRRLCRPRAAAAESPGRRETIADYLAEYGLRAEPCADFAAFVAGEARFMLGVGAAVGRLRAAGGAVGDRHRKRAVRRHRPPAQPARGDARRANLEGWLRDLSELRIGDPVVHESHGIGRYLGLVHMDYGDGRHGIPAPRIRRGRQALRARCRNCTSSRATAAPTRRPSNCTRLGSGQWEKAKKKAAEQVRDTAAELLHLYAQRAARQGHAFDFKQHDLEAFADGFGFEETPDQRAAIDAVVADMKSGKPMDRLVCGDVGFGKTEVALRAAFVAIADGKQVAVLCPTTLLAEQHYQTFADRFAGWPVKVAELSRFRSRPRAGRRHPGPGRGQDRHPHRHPSPVAEGRGLLAPRPGDHRRGTPLRRAPEGSVEGAARRGGRADAHRHADPAHPGLVAGGAARFFGDRHRAAEAPGDQDLRLQMVDRPDPRGLPARVQARRPGLLPAQRGRNHRDDARQAGQAPARGAHRRRPWPVAGARAGAGDARIHPAEAQPAALFDHHRDRHRQPARQHHHHQPRRQVRRGATAPAARPRRPLAPPGLRLPADARGSQADHPGAAPAGRDSGHGGTGLGLLPRHARPGDSRRRRGAGRKPERRDPRDRLRPLHQHAQCRRPGAEGWQGDTRPDRAAVGDFRDQPAGAGAAAERLLPGCA